MFFLLKVSNVNHLSLGTSFHLYCPKESLPNKMMIFFNGTTKDDLRYKDLCAEEHQVRIAYNNDPYSYFEVDSITNTLIEYPYWETIVNELPRISHEYVIINSFFSKYNIKPIWINCNYTWGWFDNEAGHWTGAVGQVEILTKRKY